MNIFILESTHKENAKSHGDKHVVKMVLETAQIVSSILRSYNPGVFYKPTHINHPCVIWAGENPENLLWLIGHGIALSNEYFYRFGRVHKSSEIFGLAKSVVESDSYLESVKNITYALTVPPAVMSVNIIQRVVGGLKPLTWEEVIKCYREYYNVEKNHLHKWTKRPIPSWIVS